MIDPRTQHRSSERIKFLPRKKSHGRVYTHVTRNLRRFRQKLWRRGRRTSTGHPGGKTACRSLWSPEITRASCIFSAFHAVLISLKWLTLSSFLLMSRDTWLMYVYSYIKCIHICIFIYSYIKIKSFTLNYYTESFVCLFLYIK